MKTSSMIQQINDLMTELKNRKITSSEKEELLKLNNVMTSKFNETTLDFEEAIENWCEKHKELLETELSFARQISTLKSIGRFSLLENTVKINREWIDLLINELSDHVQSVVEFNCYCPNCREKIAEKRLKFEEFDSFAAKLPNYILYNHQFCKSCKINLTKPENFNEIKQNSFTFVFYHV